MLQILAMITMLTDHIGLLFFEEHEIFRIIGRLSFPIYSFLLVQGYRRTRNVKKYLKRLLLIACVSQIPYTLLFLTFELNVVFTLWVGLAILMILDQQKESHTRLQYILLIISIFFLTTLIPMDYGIYGIILILLYRYLQGISLIGAHFGLNIFFWISAQWGLQMYSLFFTMFLLGYSKPTKRYVPAWVYRSFYPAHLVILLFISIKMRM